MKRKNSYNLMLAFFLLFPVSGLNAEAGLQDEFESKIYPTGEFSQIFLEGSFKVYLIQGNENSLEVRASDSNAFDYLNVRNKNGLLYLHVDREPFDFSRMSLYITFKTLEELGIKGSINLRTRGYLNLQDFFVRVEGGAKIEFQAKARNIGMKTEGGVFFELGGVSESLDVNVSGAGHVDAGNMKSKNVIFRVDGVGTGRVYATQTLDAKIYGMGKIRYRGNPELTEDIEGLGSIRRE
jgi:hypothetical protein